MKKLLNLILVFSLSIFMLEARADNSYHIVNDSITITKDGKSHVCKLDQKPKFSLENAVESFDKKSVIVSNVGYVKMESLDTCDTAIPVHISFIPDKVGVLVDINLAKGIYLAVDFVNVQPFRYLATIAYISSTKNLVTLPGAYIKGSKLPDQKKYAFSGSGDAESGMISTDGQYAAPDGIVDCKEDASPGVWDILKNKRVVTDEASCNQLFDSK